MCCVTRQCVVAETTKSARTFNTKPFPIEIQSTQQLFVLLCWIFVFWCTSQHRSLSWGLCCLCFSDVLLIFSWGLKNVHSAIQWFCPVCKLLLECNSSSEWCRFFKGSFSRLNAFLKASMVYSRRSAVPPAFLFDLQMPTNCLTEKQRVKKRLNLRSVWCHREADFPGRRVAAGVSPRRHGGGGVRCHQFPCASGGVVPPGPRNHRPIPQ